jgi:hypothetical protein
MFRILFTLLLALYAGTLAARECILEGEGFNLRPLAGEGPTEVSVRVYVNDLIKIADADQSFTSDVFFRVDWVDPRLMHRGPDPCNLPLANLWNPGMQLLNRRSIEKIRAPDLAVGMNGNVTLVLRGFGDFSFRADYSDFPFDQQELSFNLLSAYGVEEVKFVVHPELIAMAEDLSVANWELELAETRLLSQYIAPTERDHARLDVVLNASRRTGYYTWQAFVPLVLIVMMTWVVFWIPREFVPARIGLAATSMLTLIAYRFAISSILPPIAYLTRLDVFMVGASVLVFAALAVAVSVTYVGQSTGDQQAGSIDRLARILFPALFLLVAYTALNT